MRRESWQVAEHQAFAAGAAAAGVLQAYTLPPWFWSDQYDLNIQVLGDLPADARWPAEARRIVRGDPQTRAFSAFALRDGAIEGVVAMNMGRDIAAARRLLSRGILPTPAQLGDAGLGWNRIFKAAAST